MEMTDARYEVTVWFADGTHEVTAENLTRRDAWGIVMRLCKKGYVASVTTPATTTTTATD